MTGTPNTPSAQFRTTLFSAGKTATGIVVPPEVVQGLGHGKKPPVRVTIGAHTYPSTVAVMGGDFLVPVSAENRAKAGVAAGDEIDVTLVLDLAPRQIELPEDFARALASEPTAMQFFDGLSPSPKKWHVVSIDGAKSAETRQRRIEKSVALLRDGKAR